LTVYPFGMEVLRHLGEATRKRLILVACILGSTIVFVDSTVVNVALPAIQKIWAAAWRSSSGWSTRTC
jgi:hypothetical protein